MIYFTADEHYGHTNIIKYCNRPFQNVEEMDNTLIALHNEKVMPDDLVYHLGDFTLKNQKEAYNYISKLKGKHIFIKGSHDYWLNKHCKYVIELKIDNQYIVLCHYPMRSWAKSFHGSWQLFGHSHGRLEPIGKQWDVGVDNNNNYPVSFTEIKHIMKSREKNID